MRTIKLTALLLSLTGLAACEFFEVDDGSDADGTDSSDPTTEGETGPPPPSEGFRVFPKFMLEPIPAVVTIEVDQEPVACELDGDPEGGYVCDASPLGSTWAMIRVDRSGFETATRTPDIDPNQITDLEVHLVVEGGPAGVWSACLDAANVASCDVVCEAEMSSCAVTSCETSNVEWPIATMQTFADLECAVELDSLASRCDELPVSQDTVAVRCCCA